MVEDRAIRQATAQLLEMYEEYKRLAREIAEFSTQLARAKILGTATDIDKQRYAKMTDQLQDISDEMTFAHPLIWIGYKYEAYKNETQPIRTMKDLRVHCNKEGYICTKRFSFLNDQLQKHHLPPLSNRDQYPEDVSLGDVMQDMALRTLCDDEKFLTLWQSYEFFKKEGAAAKWQNYARS